jgi:nucleotidyltransferase substrate binding protein (TIGR01987 family)
MASLSERLVAAERALANLQALAGLSQPSEIERDAAIQRFEYSVEATWKAARHLLLEREGLDRASPKSVARACLEVGLFDERQATHALEMIDDRNLTAHTYNEALAKRIFSRLDDHSGLLEVWLRHLRSASESS